MPYNEKIVQKINVDLVNTTDCLPFYNRYKTWDTAIQCLSVLDVLMSLAKYVGAADGVTCRPEIIEPSSDTEVSIIIALHRIYRYLTTGSNLYKAAECQRFVVQNKL